MLFSTVGYRSPFAGDHPSSSYGAENLLGARLSARAQDPIIDALYCRAQAAAVAGISDCMWEHSTVVRFGLDLLSHRLKLIKRLVRFSEQSKIKLASG